MLGIAHRWVRLALAATVSLLGAARAGRARPGDAPAGVGAVHLHCAEQPARPDLQPAARHQQRAARSPGTSAPAPRDTQQGIHAPPHGQASYQTENFPGSVQTQVTGIDDRGVTVGFWSPEQRPPDANFGFYARRRPRPTASTSPPTTTPPARRPAARRQQQRRGGRLLHRREGQQPRLSPTTSSTALSSEIKVPGETSVTAAAINNRGDIAGFCTDANGNTAASCSAPTASRPAERPRLDLDPGARRQRRRRGRRRLHHGRNSADLGFVWTPGAASGPSTTRRRRHHHDQRRQRPRASSSASTPTPPATPTACWPCRSRTTATRRAANPSPRETGSSHGGGPVSTNRPPHPYLTAMVTPIVTELRRHGSSNPAVAPTPPKPRILGPERLRRRCVKRMSIQAVLSRIDVIAQAQQQLASPIGSSSSAAANAIGATLNGTAATGAAASTSFASALAQAQGTTLPGASTATGLSPTGLSPTGAERGRLHVDRRGRPGRRRTRRRRGTRSRSRSPAGSRRSSTGPPSTAGAAASPAAIATTRSSPRSTPPAPSALPAGKSNHETTQYPGGAVDVTDPAQLIQVLKGYSRALQARRRRPGPGRPRALLSHTATDQTEHPVRRCGRRGSARTGRRRPRRWPRRADDRCRSSRPGW